MFGGTYGVEVIEQLQVEVESTCETDDSEESLRITIQGRATVWRFTVPKRQEMWRNKNAVKKDKGGWLLMEAVEQEVLYVFGVRTQILIEGVWQLGSERHISGLEWAHFDHHNSALSVPHLNQDHGLALERSLLRGSETLQLPSIRGNQAVGRVHGGDFLQVYTSDHAAWVDDIGGMYFDNVKKAEYMRDNKNDVDYSAKCSLKKK